MPAGRPQVARQRLFGRIGHGPEAVATLVTREHAQDEENDDRQQRNEERDREKAILVEIMQTLHRQGHMRPERCKEHHDENRAPLRRGLATFGAQQQAVIGKHLSDTNEKAREKIDRAIDAARKAEEQPDELVTAHGCLFQFKRRPGVTRGRRLNKVLEHLAAGWKPSPPSDASQTINRPFEPRCLGTAWQSDG